MSVGKQVVKFPDLLKLLSAPTGAPISQAELRVVRLAKEMFPDLLLHSRIRPFATELDPMTPENVASAARLAIAAGIEMDKRLTEAKIASGALDS